MKPADGRRGCRDARNGPTGRLARRLSRWLDELPAVMGRGVIGDSRRPAPVPVRTDEFRVF